MQTPDKKTWTKPELIQLTGASDSANGGYYGKGESVVNTAEGKTYQPSPNVG